MGLMDDIEAITDKYAFCDVDSMLGVESVVYHPRGKSPVTINANVSRQPPNIMEGRAERTLEVFVSIEDVPTVNCPGDAVEIAFDRGHNAQRHTVKQIIHQDAGGYMLRLG